LLPDFEEEPDLDEEPDFEDEPDLEVFLLRTVEVLPELLVLVTLPEETVEDFFALR